MQRDSLLYAMGGQQANRIIRTLTFVAPEVDTKYETLVGKLTEYFIPQRNVIHERCVFQSRQTDLLKSDVVWSWDKAQQASLDKTKELLTTKPTLSYYDSTKPK